MRFCYQNEKFFKTIKNKSIFERSLNIGSIFSFEFLKGKSDKKRHHEFCPTRTNGISEFGFEQKINVKLEKK
jgi:hypothetical protein